MSDLRLSSIRSKATSRSLPIRQMLVSDLSSSLTVAVKRRSKNPRELGSLVVPTVFRKARPAKHKVERRVFRFGIRNVA